MPQCRTLLQHSNARRASDLYKLPSEYGSAWYVSISQAVNKSCRLKARLAMMRKSRRRLVVFKCTGPKRGWNFDGRNAPCAGSECKVCGFFGQMWVEELERKTPALRLPVQEPPAAIESGDTSTSPETEKIVMSPSMPLSTPALGLAERASTPMDSGYYTDTSDSDLSDLEESISRRMITIGDGSEWHPRTLSAVERYLYGDSVLRQLPRGIKRMMHKKRSTSPLAKQMLAKIEEREIEVRRLSAE